MTSDSPACGSSSCCDVGVFGDGVKVEEARLVVVVGVACDPMDRKMRRKEDALADIEVCVCRHTGGAG